MAGASNQFGAAAGEYGGRQHIVSKAVGQLCADIGGGGSNDNQIRALGKSNVLHLMHKIPVKGIDHNLAPGELLKGQRRNKFSGIFCHDHLNGSMLLNQCGCQCCCFIGGNSAGNPQQNGFSLQHIVSSRMGSILYIIAVISEAVKSGFLLVI